MKAILQDDMESQIDMSTLKGKSVLVTGMYSSQHFFPWTRHNMTCYQPGVDTEIFYPWKYYTDPRWIFIV